MKTISFVFLLLIIFCGCKKDNIEKKENIVVNNIFVSFKGQVQKGPFISGTNIMVLILDSSLKQTGRIYNTTITNNDGSFNLNSIQLASSFVELVANGYFYNEVIDGVSSASVSVSAIVKLKDSANINLNIITHLIKDRVKKLVSENYNFDSACIKANKELLSVFSFDSIQVSNSEKLDITKSGDDNAILLALSSIILDISSEGNFSQLLADFINDFKDDGKIVNPRIQAQLIYNALRLKNDRYYNMLDIRYNLLARYNILGINITVPNYEKYINKFLADTKFKPNQDINFPEYGNYGKNLLYYKDTVHLSSGQYSVKVNLLIQRDGLIEIHIPKSDTLNVEFVGGDSIGLSHKWAIEGNDFSNFISFNTWLPGGDMLINLKNSGKMELNFDVTSSYGDWSPMKKTTTIYWK